MTITDDELARLEALGARDGLSPATAAKLVAEVRECWAHARRAGERVGEAWRAHDDVCAERDDHRRRQSEAESMYAGACVNLDALRAENERLNLQRDLDVACYDEAKRERDAAIAERDALRAESERLRAVEVQLRNVIEARNGACDAYEAEAAELRASLKDAVAEVERMRPVVDAAMAWYEADSDLQPLPIACAAYEAAREKEVADAG